MHVDVGSQFRQLGSIELWKCQQSGLEFYVPPAAAGDGDLYEQLQHFAWYYMADKWEFDEALGKLDANSTLLEVGVGQGHFLRAAKCQGHNCYGVELNSKAAAIVRELGFEVYEQSLNDLSAHCAKRFDAICSFQVLEHVPNPLEFLQGMLSLLKPGGRLLLSVPNGAVMRRIDPNSNDLLNQPPHHMSHWDADVFLKLPLFLPVQVKDMRRKPLAAQHVGLFVIGYLRSALSFFGPRISRLIVNRYTILPIKLALQAGLRRFFPGHTLLVELVYQPNGLTK
jgi:2-polyprenyl-3-methyl-5-hydroxy-6-metoxy-1,4-benzoquinol methylase